MKQRKCEQFVGYAGKDSASSSRVWHIDLIILALAAGGLYGLVVNETVSLLLCVVAVLAGIVVLVSRVLGQEYDSRLLVLTSAIMLSVWGLMSGGTVAPSHSTAPSDRAVRKFQIQCIWSALEAFRARHGNYPDGLDCLVQEGYLTEQELHAPRDPSSPQWYVYRGSDNFWGASSIILHENVEHARDGVVFVVFGDGKVQGMEIDRAIKVLEHN